MRLALLPKNSEMIRFALFLGAGALNTLFGFATFAALLRAGTGNDLAVVLGTLAGIAFNFKTFGAVFAAQGYGRLPWFVGVYAAFALANVALLRLATGAGLNPYLGEAAVIAVITPLSFLAMRRLVFPPAPEYRV